jgi:Tfp pilus assembly protein PilF
MSSQEDEDQAYRKQAEQLLAHPRSRDDAARAHLTLGCIHEHEADWTAAVESYRQVLACEPCDPTVQYFGNNNLGYSLIQLGRFDEAEDYCTAAIAIDEQRHNAHKNLGLVCQGHPACCGAVDAVGAPSCRPASPAEGPPDHPSLLRARNAAGR